DLAAECDSELQARLSPANGNSGRGTEVAIAVAKSLPNARITLLRIDRDSPFQLYEVARYLNGDPVDSPSLDRRRDELGEEAARLQRAQEDLLTERREVMANFSQDPAVLARREAYQKKQGELGRQQQVHHDREGRFLGLATGLQN